MNATIGNVGFQGGMKDMQHMKYNVSIDRMNANLNMNGMNGSAGLEMNRDNKMRVRMDGARH